MNPSTHKSVQRAATRAPLGIPIRLQADDSMEVLEGVCKNISIGGMFIQVEETRPQGSLLRFELPLEDGASVRGLGEVVWMRPKSAGPGVEAGIGIKFRFLEQQDRQLIFKLVSQYIKERLSKQGEARAQTPPPPVTAPGAVFRPPDPEPVSAPPTQTHAASVPSPAPAAEQGPEGFTPPAPRSPAELASTTPAADAAPTPLAPSPQDHGLGDSWEGPGEADDLDSSELGRIEPYRPADDFRQRSPSRRPKGLMVVLAGVVLFVVLGFLFRDRLFGPGAESAEPTPATTPAATIPDPSAEVAGGEPVAGPDSSGDGAIGGGNPGGQGSDPAGTTDPAGEGQPSTQPASTAGSSADPQPGGSTASTASAEPVAPPPSAPPTATPPARRGYSNILGITWSETSDGLRVVFEGDGPIPEQRYRYFRLDGDPPREVIQFRGVEKDFEPGSLTVGGPGVEQIRTGYHTKRNRPNELHVVMDMSSRGAKVSEFRSLGFTLEVLVTVESP